MLNHNQQKHYLAIENLAQNTGELYNLNHPYRVTYPPTTQVCDWQIWLTAVIDRCSLFQVPTLLPIPPTLTSTQTRQTVAAVFRWCMARCSRWAWSPSRTPPTSPLCPCPIRLSSRPAYLAGEGFTELRVTAAMGHLLLLQALLLEGQGFQSLRTMPHCLLTQIWQTCLSVTLEDWRLP